MKLRFKAIISFLGCIAAAGFLAYYITGTGGFFILILLVAALVLDLVLFLVSSKKLEISLELNSDIINKGKKCSVKIIPYSGTPLPSGIINAQIGCTPNLSAEGENCYRFITAGNNSQSVEMNFVGDYCGLGKIYVEELVIMDFLGVIHKKITSDAACSVKIMPPIPDSGTQNEVIKNVSDNMTFDDTEEESDEISLVPTGIPGYDHRPYVPGDPLKRINWKISSKRGNLMVRLDEKSVSSSQIFLLDFPQNKKMTREYYANADKIICAGLAMLSMLLKQGYESEYIIYADDMWENVPVRDEKSLEYLQEKLAGIVPAEDANRFPPKDMNKKNKNVICFTACTNIMQGEIHSLLDNFHGTLAVTKESGIGKIEGCDVWVTDDNYSFTKL